MERRNSDVVRHLYDAFNAREYHRAADHLTPDGTCRPAFVPLEQVGATRELLTGRDELLRFFETLGSTWESVTVEVEEALDCPDGRVVAVETWHVCARDGLELDTRIVDVYVIEHGQVVSARGYLDRDEALAAEGLR
jgi:ketosteroid isomerase-like protein